MQVSISLSVIQNPDGSIQVLDNVSSRGMIFSSSEDMVRSTGWNANNLTDVLIRILINSLATDADGKTISFDTSTLVLSPVGDARGSS